MADLLDELKLKLGRVGWFATDVLELKVRALDCAEHAIIKEKRDRIAELSKDVDYDAHDEPAFGPDMTQNLEKLQKLDDSDVHNRLHQLAQMGRRGPLQQFRAFLDKQRGYGMWNKEDFDSACLACDDALENLAAQSISGRRFPFREVSEKLQVFLFPEGNQQVKMTIWLKVALFGKACSSIQNAMLSLQDFNLQGTKKYLCSPSEMH